MYEDTVRCIQYDYNIHPVYADIIYYLFGYERFIQVFSIDQWTKRAKASIRKRTSKWNIIRTFTTTIQFCANRYTNV